MASKTDVCGICYQRQINKPSDVWCSECDEGLCVECKEHHSLSKGTRDHTTVPISQYEKLPTNVLEISQFCSEHKEKFQIYCKKHERPCCSRCIVSDHQKCQDFSQLDDIIRNVKKSYGFREIEQTMVDMIENIQKIKKDRQENLSRLKEEREMIEKEILQTRMNINAHLDNLQEAFIKELYEAESKESNMIGQLLDAIEKHQKEIEKYQESFIHIKQHASDLKTFLAMKQMERDVSEKDNYLISLVESNKLNRVSLSCQMNDAFRNRFKEMKRFGELKVSTHSSEMAIVRKREIEAQSVVAHAMSMSIDSLSFVLQLTVDTKLQNITGCALLPDCRMVFSCYHGNLVRVFNSNGSHDFDINLQPTSAFEITYIQNNNTIAVTSGGKFSLKSCITIIDVESRKVKETIPIQSSNYGIVSRNNTLIYFVPFKGLQMINLSDKSVNDIVAIEMDHDAYVAAFGDKVYYTNWKTHTVTCCDFRGTTKWKFNDESRLKQPQGISVDNAGNVYVAGYASNNVVVISPDGKRCRQLLSTEDSLNAPIALHYDGSTNQLLLANQTGKSFLYRLE